MRNPTIMIMLLALGCVLPAAAQGKDSFTPMALDSGFGPMDITAPATPPEQIIKQFAAKESEFQQALNHYTYRRIARVQTLDDDNKVDGEWYEVDDVIFDYTGSRSEKVVYAPGNTLQRILMTPSDLQDIQHGYPFVLTAEDIGQYDVKYVGRQKVDEVDCFVFDVSPKVIEKKKRYLLGRIWVDSTDLQIVVTNGRMVPDDTRWPLLVPGVHQGRGHLALLRRKQLHGPGRPHPRHHQVLRLQTVRLKQQDHLQRPGHHAAQGAQYPTATEAVTHIPLPCVAARLTSPRPRR